MDKYRVIKTVDSMSELAQISKEDSAFVCVGDDAVGGMFQYVSSNYTVNDGIDVFDGWTRIDTISALLARLKTVDGSGSGIDADLLDGVEGAAYSQLAVNETVSGAKTFSNAVVNMTALPTADPLAVGQLWNNAGAVTVSAG